MVSDFASDIDPGPGDSFWRAGRTLSWPACIGFLEPGTRRVYAALWMVATGDGFSCQPSLWADTSLCVMLGWMEGGYMCIPAEMCMKFFASGGEVECTLILV